jgi:hypothetical protein
VCCPTCRRAGTGPGRGARGWRGRRAGFPPRPADVFPARFAAVAILIIVMAVWLVLAAWFSQRGYGYGYGYPPH